MFIKSTNIYIKSEQKSNTVILRNSLIVIKLYQSVTTIDPRDGPSRRF